MERYLLYSQNIKESPIAGCEAFPGEMLGPSSEKVIMSSEMLDIMVDYYNATYPANNFRKPFGEGPEDSIIIRVRMNQFRRCRIGSEIFGSKMSSHHVKSSFVTAKFIIIDDDVDIYPGQVQYYFTHTVDLPNSPAEHFLAYVRWYKHAGSRNIRYYFSSNNDINTCNIELWEIGFYLDTESQRYGKKPRFVQWGFEFRKTTKNQDSSRVSRVEFRKTEYLNKDSFFQFLGVGYIGFFRFLGVGYIDFFRFLDVWIYRFRLSVLGLDIWISAFGSWFGYMDFGFQFLGFGCTVSTFGWVLDIWVFTFGWALDIWVSLSDFCQIAE
ncbi:hypothetical protein GLOIN_2v1775288 [Rhizophagus irregularis DAOM 181602=DAOM 197198]|nr:hypothetical protein GLOIN_2v1775288 [Rhizophagus irregularis DAOM 181602=DAOM 197198]